MARHSIRLFSFETRFFRFPAQKALSFYQIAEGYPACAVILILNTLAISDSCRAPVWTLFPSTQQTYATVRPLIAFCLRCRECENILFETQRLHRTIMFDAERGRRMSATRLTAIVLYCPTFCKNRCFSANLAAVDATSASIAAATSTGYISAEGKGARQWRFARGAEIGSRG